MLLDIIRDFGAFFQLTAFSAVTWQMVVMWGVCGLLFYLGIRKKFEPLLLVPIAFGALLLAPDHETVLAEQGNIDTVNHAEATLARTVASQYAPDFLWDCSLVTTFEPCAMCAATASMSAFLATPTPPQAIDETPA